MIPERLSSDARSLLRGARDEGPSQASRDRMWSDISSATAAAAAVATSAKVVAAASKAGIGVSKLGLFTTLFGAAATVGTAALLIHVATARHTPKAGLGERREVASGFASTRALGQLDLVEKASSLGINPSVTPRTDTIFRNSSPAMEISRGAEPVPSVHGPAVREATVRMPTVRMPAAGMTAGPAVRLGERGVSAAPAESGEHASGLAHVSGRLDRTAAPPPHQGRGGVAVSEGRTVEAQRAEDRLAAEATLAEKARASVNRGDGPAALLSIAAAKRLGTNQLAPELLALEVRALRLTGKTAEATERENELRTRFPNEALLQ